MRFWKREWLFWLVALAVLSGAAGFAWLTRNPSSPVVDRAMTWPVLGDWARGFAERYRQPAVVRRPEGSTGAAADLPGPRVQRGGTSGAEGPLGARPRVWLTEATVLRDRPHGEGRVIARVDPVTQLVQTDRQGGWYGVDWGGETAWVFLPDYSEVSDPPLGNLAEPVLPVLDMAPEPQRLATARRLLVGPERSFQVGAYTLYTDVQDPAMVVGFQQVVPTLEEAYAARYGVTPIGEPRAALVVFGQADSYEQFKRLEGSLVGRRSSGHVGRGIVALYRQGRSAQEVRSTLLHELVHLLNRRAIGPALPPWLDEGIAEDLAGSAVSEDGRLEPGTIEMTRVVEGNGWRMTGADAALVKLRRRLAIGTPISVAELCGLDDESFQKAESQVWNYARAGFLVRFLMARYPAELRSFVAAISRGERPDGERLRAATGRSWERLDEEFTAWLKREDPRRSGSAD